MMEYKSDITSISIGIGKGTNIDHFCHIGNNSNIDEHNIIMCNSTILGSVNIGPKNTIGAGNMIRENIKVGSESFIGMRSSVLKNVLDKEVWYGSPAKLQSKK